ncbi:MAG: hypothetical protein IPM54_25895 [Polyangiaceae bacterium]|nr:hypothetical protein [Polyangiaceae bacterium]
MKTNLVGRALRECSALMELRCLVYLRIIAVMVIAVGLVGCSKDRHVEEHTAQASQRVISDQPRGGHDGFFWLWPLVPNPTLEGSFDATQSPTVRISECARTCSASGVCTADCTGATVIATYTKTSGPGYEVVRVNPILKNYYVYWHTWQFALSAAKIYRIDVLLGGYVAGTIDVQPVTTLRQLKNVDTNEMIPLVNGFTLPIRWFLNRCGSVFCAAQDQCHDAGSCDPATGTCSNPAKANGAACSDGNACTQSDTCQEGACTAGTAVDVDDGNPCTVDACDPIEGPSHEPAAAGSSCSDGDMCNGVEMCNDIGECESGVALVVDDGDDCTADSCDPLIGAVHTPIDGCTAPANSEDTVFETRASLFGRVVTNTGVAATGYTVSIFDNVDVPSIRSDVSTSIGADGSFRARLTQFPTSAPVGSAPHHVLVRIQSPGFLDVFREAYLMPTDASDLGDIVVVAHDPQVTVIGPEGGVAKDSRDLMEIVIPAGALAAPTPIRITPFTEREELPFPLPTGTITTYAFEAEPDGTQFAVPATIRVKNDRNVPTTAAIPVGYVDKSRGRWLHAGTATWDGTHFAVEVTHFSIYDINGSSPSSDNKTVLGSGNDPSNTDDECVGSSAGLANGTLRQTFTLPGYMRHGQMHSLTLAYDAFLAGSTELAGQVPANARASTSTSTLKRSTRPVVAENVCVNAAGSTAVCGSGAAFGGNCTIGTKRPTARQASVSVTPPGTAALKKSTPAGRTTATGAALVSVPLNEANQVVGPSFLKSRVEIDDGQPVAFGSGGTFGGRPDCAASATTDPSLRTGPIVVERYTFVNHRMASPYGAGWGIREIERLYRDPVGSQAVLVKGDGSQETFRPRAIAEHIPTPTLQLPVSPMAKDGTTGELFAAEMMAQNGASIVRIEEPAGGGDAVITVVASGLPPGWAPRSMAITYVGGIRHFVVATSTQLLDIAEGGTTRTLQTRTNPQLDTMVTVPQVAAMGDLAYYHDGLGGPLVRFRLSDAATAEQLTPTAGGERGIDHDALLGAVRFGRLGGMSMGPDGGLFVIDQQLASVYKLLPDDQTEISQASSVWRVVGDGFGAFIPAVTDVAPGKAFPLADPLALSVAPDGAVWIVNGFGAAVWTPDPARPLEGLARWMVASGPQGGEIDRLFFDEMSAHLAESRTALVSMNFGVFRRYSVTEFASEEEPLRSIAYSPNGEAELVDQRSEVVTSFDEKGRVLERRLRSGKPIHTVEYEPDSSRVSRIVDPSGEALTLTYGPDGKLKTMTDPAGRTTTFDTDAEGDLVQMTEPTGETRGFTYAGHKMTEKRNARGDVTQYGYTASGTLDHVVRPGGAEMFLVPALATDPDATNMHSGVYTDERGVVHTFAIDGFGRASKKTYVADGVTYVVEQRRPEVLDETFTLAQLKRRNTIGRVSHVAINGLLQGYERVYDGMGRLKRVHAPEAFGTIEEYAYDEANRLTHLVVPNRPPMTFEYDAAGRLVRQAEQAGFGVDTIEQTWTYRPDGLIASRTSHDVTTTYSYDAQGNLVSTSDTTGRVVTYTRDPLGRPIGASDGTVSASSTFDDGNRLTAMTDARGNVTTFGYTQMPCGCTEGSRVTSMRTPDLAAGKKWTFDYGVEGRLVAVTDPEGNTESYTHTAEGKLASTTDALGRVNAATYDELGRPKTLTDALGRVRSQAYPIPHVGGWLETGLLVAGPGAIPPGATLTSPLDDGEYQVGASAFTSRAKSITEKWTLGLPRVTAYRDATMEVSYAYEHTLRGNVSKVTDRASVPIASDPFAFIGTGEYVHTQTSFSLAARGEFPNRDVAPSNLGNFLEDTNYFYSDHYELVQADAWSPLGMHYQWVRDTAGRITEEKRFVSPPGIDHTALPTTFTYRPDGLIATEQGPAGNKTFTYDDRGQLATMTIAGEGTYTFGYDEVGRNVLLEYPDGHVREQSFDELGRITQRCYVYAAPAATRCYEATYDAVGNPVTMSDPECDETVEVDPLNRLTKVTRVIDVAGGGTVTEVEDYAYNALGALRVNGGVSLDDQRPRKNGAGTADSAVPASVGGDPVGLDPVGRVTMLGDAAFGYNRQSKLQQVTTSADTETFGYDTFGRRISRRKTSTGAIEWYVHDGAQNVSAVLTLNGQQVKVAYVFDGVDHPLGLRTFDPQTGTVTATLYYEVDLAGNVRRLRGPGGSDEGGYRYSAFGKAYPADAGTPAPSMDQPLRWKGRWYEPVAGGVYDVRARWWSPEAGVFLSIDGLEYHDATTTLWGWPGQNPWRWSDPSGKDGCSATIGAAGIFDCLACGVLWESGPGVLVCGIACGLVHLVASELCPPPCPPGTKPGHNRDCVPTPPPPGPAPPDSPASPIPPGPGAVCSESSPTP